MLYQTLDPVPPPTYDRVVPQFETLLSSEARGWRNLQVYRYKLAPQPEPVPGPIIEAHTLPIILRGTNDIRTFVDGRVHRAQVHPGSMSLVPRGTPTAYSWTGASVVSHIYLSPALTCAAAEDIDGAYPEKAELILRPYFRDPFIEQLGLVLLNELESGGLLGNLYIDTLAQALVLHLLRHHSSFAVTYSPPARGLPQQQLRLVLDYINENLATDISLGELANLTGLSLAYFTRQFKISTGLPPHQYLIHRRVERAKELLTSSISTVAEVSQVVGFYDQSHLDRHFKRLLKVLPKDVKVSRNVQTRAGTSKTNRFQ